MADSLLDRVGRGRKALLRGPSGELVETSTEEVQQLAGKAGLAAPPIDPLSTAAIGGNEYQKRMAGTPAQAGAALRIAQDSNQSLADAERRLQPRSEATQQEAATQQKSKDLQDLGQLGDRVNTFIEGQRKRLESAAVTTADVQVTPGAVSGLPTDPAQLGAVKQAAKQLLANPGDMQALLTLNQSLGRNTNSTVTPEELQQLYESSASTIARSGAANVENDLDVSDLIAAGTFPYDANQIGELLGVPSAEISKYSIAQLRDRLEQVSQEEFSGVQQLEQKATSGVLGVAERATARGMAREASRTGLRSTEQDMQKLEQSIANADQVSFGGQTYQVDDLLRDDTISGLVSDYLNSAPGSEVRTRLESTEPELIRFIQSNEAVLDDAAKQMAAGAQQFTDVQKANQAIQQVAGVDVAPELMKALFSDFGELRADRYDPTQTGFYQRLAALDDAGKQQFVNAANEIAHGPLKDLTPELAQLSADELAALELERGPRESPKIRALIANREAQAKLATLSPDNPADIVSTYTQGQYNNVGALQNEITDNTAASILGIGGTSTSAFDSDGDGKVDDPKTILENMQKATPKATLRDAIQGKATSYATHTLEPYDPAPGPAAIAFSKLRDVAADGKLTPEEVRGAKFTEDELYGLEDLPQKWGAAGSAIPKMLRDFRTKRTADILTRYDAPIVTGSKQALKEASKEPFDIGGGQKADVVSFGSIQKFRDGANTAQARLDQLIKEQAKWRSSGNPKKVDDYALTSRIDFLRNAVRNNTARASELAAERTKQIEAARVAQATRDMAPALGGVREGALTKLSTGPVEAINETGGMIAGGLGAGANVVQTGGEGIRKKLRL